MLWIAGFDNTTKVWLAYDPSGTLDPSILGQHLPSDYQPGELIQLKEGNTYLIAISEQVTLRGDTLDEGIYQRSGENREKQKATLEAGPLLPSGIVKCEQRYSGVNTT